MSHPIIIPVRFGTELTNDVVCDCEMGKCERRGMCEVPIGYLCGRKPPNYPVPAIRRRVNYASLWSVLRWIGYLPSGFPRF